MKFYNYINEKFDISKLPDYITYDSKLRSEAEYFSIDNIKIGPKFNKLPDKEAQKHVIIHELGHMLSDSLLKNGVLWKWLDNNFFMGNFNGREIFGLNGHTTPGEITSEAFAVLITEPGFLEKHYKNLYDELKKILKQSKYKEILKRAKNIYKL